MLKIEDFSNFEIIDSVIKLPILVYQGDYIIHVNKEAINFLGYSEEELKRMKFWEVVHPDFRSIVKSRGMERQEGKDVISEYRIKILTGKGEIKWIYFKGERILFKGEVAVIVSGIDITNEIDHEKEVRESEKRYRNLFYKYNELIKLILNMNFSPDTDIKEFLSNLLHAGYNLIDEADAGSCFIYKNNKVYFVDCIGHDIDQLKKLDIQQAAFSNVNKGVQIFNVDDKKENYLNPLQHVYESLTFDLYLNGMKYCGLTFDIIEKNKHFSEESKKIISAFYNLSSALLSIKFTADELKNEKSYFETIFESIGEGIIITDNDLKIKNMNRQANKITGFKLKEIYDKEISLVFTIFDFDSIEPIKITRSNINTLTKREKRKALILDKYSKEKPISYKIDAIVEKKDSEKNINSDNLSGYIFVFEDISRIYTLEEQLRKSQLNETIGKLAGGIAHDFNNILGGILGAAEIIKEKVRNEPEVIEFANLIIDSTAIARGTTSKLLTLTRKIPHSFKINDAHEIIKSSLNIAKQALNKNIEIKFIPEAKHSKILCFEPDLQNALINLYINANDAMPDGGLLTIKTENFFLFKDIFNEEKKKYLKFSLKKDAYIKIIIKDTGVGIKKEVINKIFDPYFTLKESGKGTGLGLASVRSVVESLQGVITVESEEMKGTEFEILLPVIIKEKTATKKGDKGKGKSSTNKDFISGYAVVIDDEEGVRVTTSKLLQFIGFKTIECKDGFNGINKVKENIKDIKIIFLDLVMPGIGGKEVLRELRKINQSIPVVIMSGYIKNENIDELLSMGNTYFLSKPFTREELIEVLSRIY